MTITAEPRDHCLGPGAVQAVERESRDVGVASAGCWSRTWQWAAQPLFIRDGGRAGRQFGSRLTQGFYCPQGILR
jgi:hypothetical protein